MYRYVTKIFCSQALRVPFPVGLEPFYTRSLQPASRTIIRIDSETRQRNHETSLLFLIFDCLHFFYKPLFAFDIGWLQ
jgi:hypothetical protein